jgi:hypothetical protein
MKYQVRISIITSFIFLSCAICQAQESTRIRNVFSFTPSKVNRINGLAVGIWNKPLYHRQKINGISIEIIGSGWLTPFIGLDDGGYLNKTIDKQTINGLSLGLTLMNGKVNGLAISPLINTTYYLNGLKIGLVNVDLYVAKGMQLGVVNINDKNKGFTIGIYNQSKEVRGLQIGLINRTQTLKGIQIGFVNINKSKTTFFLNWRSKKN